MNVYVAMGAVVLVVHETVGVNLEDRGGYSWARHSLIANGIELHRLAVHERMPKDGKFEDRLVPMLRAITARFIRVETDWRACAIPVSFVFERSR